MVICNDLCRCISPIQRGDVRLRRVVSMPAANSRSVAQFCQEVSEVINRVRGAFGPIPMKIVADQPEIKAAEATIEQAARLVRSGLENVDVWRGALVVYELTWMSALKKVRQAGKSAA